MKNEILESLRPWDCEIFDKDPCSPFICYCGGGGGPKPPKLPVPQLPPTPTFNDPLQNINLTPSQGNLDSLASFGQNVTSSLDKNIGIESNFGKKMLEGTEYIRSGIGHNLEQIKDTLDRSDLNVANWGPKGGSNQEQASSANYSGSKKKGKQASSQEGTMGKNRERLQKRDALKVKKKQG